MTQTISTKDNHFNRKVYLLIFALVFVLYGNSIRNNYALDDNYVTVTTPEKPNNPRIEKGIRGIPKLFTTHYVESASQSFEYRPLVLVTFAIEYQFFGSNPHISHFISVLLYAITCMLLFMLLSKLLKNYNLIFPLLVVFLFIIHPIHTEVVDNIKCRDELLSFLFGICSLYYFLKNTEDKKLKFVLLGILFLVMGFLCKRTAMLFMAIIPLTIYFFTAIKLKKIVLVGLIIFITFFIYDSIKSRLISDVSVQRDFVFFENPLYFKHGILNRIPMAFYTLGYYLKLLLIPYPLSCYYGYNTIPMSDWGSLSFIVSALFYLAIGIYALIKLPQKSVLSYGILLYLGCIFPVANILKPATGIVAERFIYFASFGFCMAVAYLLLKLFKVDIKAGSKFKTAQQSAKPLKNKTDGLIQNINLSFKLTLTGILILFSYLTIARNNKWKDQLTLFRNDVKHFENSYFLHYFITQNIYPLLTNMPVGYKKDALINEMQTHYKQAAELLRVGLEQYKTDYFSMTTLGTIYNNQFNNVDAALPYFKKSLSINPDYDVTRFNLILCYEKKNQPDSAILLYEKMISKNTTYPPVYFNLHELYVNKHASAKAILCDIKAVKQIPIEYRAKAYVNLGNAYMLNKDTLYAVESFEKAIEFDSNDSNLRSQILNFLKSIGYTERAEKLNKK